MNIDMTYRRLVSAAAVLSALCALCSPSALGQRYERIVERNMWNTTSNVCGVRSDSVSVSQAQIYGKYKGGDFRDLSDAPSLWSAGAFAETVSHFRRVSMTGKFSFDNEEAYNACGSMLSVRDAFPVDIYEFTPGRKTRQTYIVEGGIATELSPSVLIGGKVDYLSSNRAKRKDLRSTVYLMDLKLTPSMLIHFGRSSSIGLSYSYHRVSESLSAEELGISSESYYAFLDKGMMYGSYDVWTGGATHLNEAGVSGFPLRQNIHSLALQFACGGFIAELSGTLGSGKAGEKDVRWFGFRNDGLSMFLGWKGGPHSARLKLSADRKSSTEDIIDRVTENGVTTTVNYGSRDILSCTLWSASPEYRFLSDCLDLRAGLSFDYLAETSTLVYPYLAKTLQYTAGAYVSGLYSLYGFDIGLGLSYRQGEWKDSLDNSAPSLGVSSAPKRLDELDVQGRWYAAAKEYETAGRLGVDLSLRYNFRFGLFLGASADYLHGFSLSVLPGADRITAALNIGYAF